jgi:hypothetical protein
MVLAKIAQQGQVPNVVHHAMPPHENFWDGYNPVSAFVFAYEGQAVFLEIMNEMKEPKDWPKAAVLGSGLMIPIYTITGEQCENDPKTEKWEMGYFRGECINAII